VQAVAKVVMAISIAGRMDCFGKCIAMPCANITDGLVPYQTKN